MNKLILFLLVSSVGQAATISWNAEVLKQVESAQTIKDLTCTTSGIAGQELCDLYKKDQAKKVKFQIERVDDATIRIHSGSMSVKVEHTDKPLQYMINDRMIDLNKYPNQERLRFAITAALAPRHASGFEFMSSAWAEAKMLKTVKLDKSEKKESPKAEEEIDPDEVTKAAALQGLTVMDGQFSMCAVVPIENKEQENAKKDPFLTFVETCEANSDAILQYISSKDEAYRKANANKIKNEISRKLTQAGDKLKEVDGTISAKYRNAFACDCKDNPEQDTCKTKKTPEMFLAGIDESRMSEPRQKGMFKCRRLLDAIAGIPDLLSIHDAERVKRLRGEIDQKISDIKSEPPNIGAPGNSAK